MTNSIGAAMAGGGGKRVLNDFYPTPSAATIALVAKELPYISRFETIWEPACGDGAISKLIPNNVISTDLIDRGYGTQLDFLTSTKLADAIITNPPYAIVDNFINKAIELDVEYLALLVKAQYWNVAKRISLWNNFPPTIEYRLTWRLDCLNLGRPTMDFTWCVWDKARGPTKNIDLLERPKT